ncbi:MAG: glycosyltransferase [Thermoplasmatales archaeon]|nr:glycosyltransferase [Candidatus Thermoplasmatota archaeon]MCL6002790.1 glycosyltransferase [Candidatus Thermoplasmatota archaeon]MDA8056135.1 glycosyltransferase [Thermoplasmatales archaeon]
MLTIFYPVIKTQTGSRRYSEKIIEELSSIGYDFRKIGIRKIEFSFRGRPFGGIFSQKIATSLHKNSSHPIHALTPEVAPTDTDIVTVLDVIPFIQNKQFITSEYNKRAYELMFRNVYEAQKFIVPTNTVKSDLAKIGGVDESRIQTIYLSIDHTKFFYDPENPYPNNGKMHLVTVGDFNPRKRFDLLYDIIGGDNQLELYHIGPINSWSERANELTRLAKKKGNIFVLGQIDDLTLRKYLSNADLFVYISDAEGFGFPPLEAMACGTNVVLNDLPIFKETVGDYGFLASIEKFEDAIQFALKNKKSSSVLRERALNFSRDREISDLLTVYREFDKS